MIRTFLFGSRPNQWLEAVWNTYAHHTINFHKLFFPRLLNDKSRNCQWFKLRLFYIIYRLVTDIQNAQTLWQLIFNAIEAQNPSIINDERYAHFQANRKIRGGGPDLIGLFAPTNCTYNRWHFHHHHHWQCPWYDSVARANRGFWHLSYFLTNEMTMAIRWMRMGGAGSNRWNEHNLGFN